jgi:hypothetical protein
MPRQRIWLTAAVLLAIVWSIVAVVMRETDGLVSWPGKVLELVEEAPWLKGQSLGEEKRRQYLAQVIANYLRLDAKQRRSLREDDQSTLDRFFASLTDAEKKEYVDRTIEPLFEVIDKALKVMPEEERKRIVGRFKGDVKGIAGNHKEGGLANLKDREWMESIMAEDPMMFLREAPLKTKLELAPLLEDMQSRVQGMRR